jgi:hypothetical protein
LHNIAGLTRSRAVHQITGHRPICNETVPETGSMPTMVMLRAQRSSALLAARAARQTALTTQAKLDKQELEMTSLRLRLKKIAEGHRTALVTVSEKEVIITALRSEIKHHQDGLIHAAEARAELKAMMRVIKVKESALGRREVIITKKEKDLQTLKTELQDQKGEQDRVAYTNKVESLGNQVTSDRLDQELLGLKTISELVDQAVSRVRGTVPDPLSVKQEYVPGETTLAIE